MDILSKYKNPTVFSLFLNAEFGNGPVYLATFLLPTAVYEDVFCTCGNVRDEWCFILRIYFCYLPLYMRTSSVLAVMYGMSGVLY